MESRALDCDGRALRWYSVGADDAPVTVFWHHGTPNIGEPPAPLLKPAADRGIRFLALDRPGYGGSERVLHRSVADVVEDVTRVADAAGVWDFVVMGHSGGGPHALACAALMPGRVTAAATVAGLAPLTSLKQHWWEGMAPAGLGELRAALKGANALRELLENSDYDPEMFTPSDHRALEGEWDWFNEIAAAGVAHGLDGMVLDDLAYVQPWGYRVDAIKVPALVVQGSDDRVVPVQHGRWLAETIPGAEYRELEGEGHLSVMRAGVDVLDWLVEHAG